MALASSSDLLVVESKTSVFTFSILLLWPATLSTLCFICSSYLSVAFSSFCAMEADLSARAVDSRLRRVLMLVEAFSWRDLMAEVLEAMRSFLFMLASLRRFSMFSLVGEGLFQDPRRVMSSVWRGERGLLSISTVICHGSRFSEA